MTTEERRLIFTKMLRHYVYESSFLYIQHFTSIQPNNTNEHFNIDYPEEAANNKCQVVLSMHLESVD